MPAFDDIFELKKDEGEDKVSGLAEAIRRHIKPGMVLHIDSVANAATRQIIKQFSGTAPGFTVVHSSAEGYVLDLVECGLVTKLITSSCFEFHPRAGPSAVIQRAYQQKKIDIEGWSLNSLLQRLMAGALGVGFMPTKSIVGSSMAEENKDSFMEIEEPFGSSGRVGLIKALNPDISITHAWAADRNGNLILAPSTLGPMGYGEWGSFASKNGVVATVENLVSTQFIREHSSLVKVPGYLVKSVSVVPFGAHPQGLGSIGVGEFEEYESDYEALEKHRAATKKPETLDAWLKEWVTDCANHEDYLQKVGQGKLTLIKEEARRGSNRAQKLSALLDDMLKSTKYSPNEMMIAVAVRTIKEKAIKNKYNIILCGVGASALSAWAAYYQLREEGCDIELAVGSGFYGYAPRPGDAQLQNAYNLSTCKMVGDVFRMYGVFVGGEGNRCLSILGAAQIDNYGNINSTKSSDGLYLIGSGGGNDAANAAEIVVITGQSKERFVEKLPYITSAGDRVTTVITDRGIFEKIGGGVELILTGYFTDPSLPNTEAVVKSIKENCGWELKASPKLNEMHPPTLDELVQMRLLDPEGYFTK